MELSSGTQHHGFRNSIIVLTIKFPCIHFAVRLLWYTPSSPVHESKGNFTLEQATKVTRGVVAQLHSIFKIGAV